MTEENYYWFLFYHAFRSKKKAVKGRPGGYFDPQDFEDVYAEYSKKIRAISNLNRPLTQEDIPDPPNGCQWNTVENVTSSIKFFWSHQKTNCGYGVRWEDIHTSSIKCISDQ